MSFDPTFVNSLSKTVQNDPSKTTKMSEASKPLKRSSCSQSCSRWRQDNSDLGIPPRLFTQTAQKISNGRKMARIAPIWTKIWQNRSQRLKLSFEKVFRATRAQKQRFQFFFAPPVVWIKYPAFSDVYPTSVRDQWAAEQHLGTMMRGLWLG